MRKVDEKETIGDLAKRFQEFCNRTCFPRICLYAFTNSVFIKFYLRVTAADTNI